jgi:hypothetical protein
MKFEFLEALKSSFLIGFVTGIIRLLVLRDSHWKEKLTSFVLSVLLAVTTGFLLRNSGLDKTWEDAAVAGIALLGQPILQITLEKIPNIIVKIYDEVPEFIKVFFTYIESKFKITK